MPLILGLLLLILLLWAAGFFRRSNSKLERPALPVVVGSIALIFAILLLLRGEIGPAVVLGIIGLGSLGWITLLPANFAGRFARRPARVSRVRTAFLEMELDHMTGVMRGHILAGPHDGASLDSLDPVTLIGLLGEIDGDSRDLLAAYLDRRQPSWREHAQSDAGAGRGGRTAASGKMTEQEAYQILGVEAGASAADISRAHRSLMKKLHPDQGGSTYLAARVNEAKEVLLRRHR